MKFHRIHRLSYIICTLFSKLRFYVISPLKSAVKFHRYQAKNFPHSPLILHNFALNGSDTSTREVIFFFRMASLVEIGLGQVVGNKKLVLTNLKRKTGVESEGRARMHKGSIAVDHHSRQIYQWFTGSEIQVKDCSLKSDDPINFVTGENMLIFSKFLIKTVFISG